MSPYLLSTPRCIRLCRPPGMSEAQWQRVRENVAAAIDRANDISQGSRA